MYHLDRVERDLDLALRQPAGIIGLPQAVQPAEDQRAVSTGPDSAAPGPIVIGDLPVFALGTGSLR